MRRTALLAVVGALLLAGCGGTLAPATDNPATPTAGPDGPGNATVTEAEPGDTAENGTTMADQPRPDPETDRLGWENGYWYNDPLAVNNTANLTAEQREAVIARSMARVERVRNLEFNSTVEVSIRSRANASLGGGERSAALREFDNAKFEAAFFIGEEEDSLSVQQESRNQTVAGYYDPESESIVIVSDAATPTLDGEGTLSHELTHAVQDQRLNLSVQRRAETRDGYNGVLGLIEGEANAVQQAYTARCGAEWRCLSPPDSGGDGGDPSPPPNWGTYFLEFFPYSDGPDFIASLREGDDWSRVSAAYDDPPRSAQVVIEPDEYGSFEAETVALADRTGERWERVRPPDRPDYGTLGRSGLGAMFARTIYDDSNSTSLVAGQEWLNLDGTEVNTTDPLNYDLAVTRGWTGDRLHVYRNGDELGYVWRIAWESPADAERFADAYRALLSYWGGDRVAEGVWVIDDGPFADAFRVTVDGSEVTVTNAPTRAELGGVRAP
jgi:hypothetical protein